MTVLCRHPSGELPRGNSLNGSSILHYPVSRTGPLAYASSSILGARATLRENLLGREWDVAVFHQPFSACGVEPVLPSSLPRLYCFHSPAGAEYRLRAANPKNGRASLGTGVIGQFMKVQFITYYNLAAIFVTYFRHFIGHAASPFFPVFSRYHGTGDTQALRRTFLRASKTLTFLAVLAAGNLMGSAYPFLKLWVGQILAPEHVLLGYQVLLVLLLPFTVELTQSIAVNLIYGMGQHHRLTTLNGLEGLANLILSIVLVQRFGLVGVALGTGIPLVVTQMGFVSRIVCRLDRARRAALHLAVHCDPGAGRTGLGSGANRGLSFDRRRDLLAARDGRRFDVPSFRDTHALPLFLEG